MASWRARFSRLLTPRTEAVGLEVGTSALKVVELRAGTPPKLRALALRPLLPGLIQDDQVSDPAGLSGELGALFAEAEIGTRSVVTAVSNRLAVTRNIQMPKMPLRDLQSAIKWEAERYLPFPIDEVVLDHVVLDNPNDVPDGGEIEVLIAAARLDMVSQLVDALKLAGLEPVVVDIKPFALLRSLRGSLLGERSSAAALGDGPYTEAGDIGVVLEIAASGSTITLVRGERVVMNRNLGVSGDDFTAAVQRAFGLDFDDAEAIKVGYGAAARPQDEAPDPERQRFSPVRVHDALRPVLGDLINEVRRSLEFFRVQSGEATITRMFLAGGGAKLHGLCAAVSGALGVHAELGDPWLTVASDRERFEADYLRRVAPEFSVPLGLALRGVSGLD